MSSVLYMDGRFIGLFDYLLSESIKPNKKNFGTNQEFDNGKFFRANNMVGTSFIEKGNLYTCTLNTDNGVISFHFSYVKDINFSNFDYFENIIRTTNYELAAPTHAAKIFGYIFYILLEMVSKYNLKYIKFNAENSKLDKFYATLFRNKLFVKEFESRGYEFIREGDFFIFKAK